jgi:hypothetical protein
MDAATKAKFEQEMSMHCYLATSSFQRIKEGNLAHALKSPTPQSDSAKQKEACMTIA